MEYMSWAGKNPPEHEANMVFTQLLGGPMDFTPGIRLWWAPRVIGRESWTGRRWWRVSIHTRRGCSSPMCHLSRFPPLNSAGNGCARSAWGAQW